MFGWFKIFIILTSLKSWQTDGETGLEPNRCFNLIYWFRGYGIILTRDLWFCVRSIGSWETDLTWTSTEMCHIHTSCSTSGWLFNSSPQLYKFRQIYLAFNPQWGNLTPDPKTTERSETSSGCHCAHKWRRNLRDSLVCFNKHIWLRTITDWLQRAEQVGGEQGGRRGSRRRMSEERPMWTTEGRKTQRETFTLSGWSHLLWSYSFTEFVVILVVCSVFCCY